MKKYTNLKDIVKQLEMGKYESTNPDGNPLELNKAFIALKEMAEKE